MKDIVFTDMLYDKYFFLRGYDFTQLCLNGHVINRFVSLLPENNKKHCPICGKSTIYQCTKCNKEIEGRYIENVAIDALRHGIDTSLKYQFCIECGEPYPWTVLKLEATNELAKEMYGLSEEEQVRLRGCLDEFLRCSPQRETAAVRLLKLMKTTDEGTISFIRDLICNLYFEVAVPLMREENDFL